MVRKDIKEFLKEVLGPNTELVDQGEWVSTHCPFARWTHANGTDRSMSFGIKENQYDKSIYNCFTCKKKGTIPDMLESLETYTGEDYSDLIGNVEDDEFLGGSLPDWDSRASYDTKNAELGEPVSDDYLDIYDSAAGNEYLESRGIDYETAEALDLRYDPDNKGVERILFPVYSREGAFYGYTGRAIVSGIDPRIRDYFGLPKRLLLLGSEFVNSDTDTYVVLVEGLFDFARGYSYDIPTVASMHSGITPAQTRILKDIGLPVYVFYDDDEAGKKGLTVVRDALHKHVPLLKVRYPKEKTVWDAKLEEYRAPADPDELTKKQFMDMIGDARLL